MVVTLRRKRAGSPGKPRRAPGPGGEGGFALFIVLMAVLLLVAAGALMALHIQNRLALIRDQERNLRLQTLIDSGYAFAASRSYGSYGYAGFDEIDLDGGVVEIDVEFIIGLGIPSGLRRVELAAYYRGEVRRALGVYRLPAPGERPELYGIEPVPLSPSDHIGFE